MINWSIDSLPKLPEALARESRIESSYHAQNVTQMRWRGTILNETFLKEET